MDNKEINLDIIKKQFREKGAAAKGFRTLSTLIKTNNIVSMQILLRKHIDNPIRSYFEVIERDNIDFLIEYFSILEIGLIANYFPNPLPLKAEREIVFILNDKFVKKYFTEYYPLALPQLLLKQVLSNKNEKYFYRDDLKAAQALFDKFLMLNHIVNNDEDIDQFLWFLDDGWTGGFSVSDFWSVLLDKNTIEYKLGSNNKHPLNNALWGFIKYIQFLSDFADLLRDSNEDYLLQSAFWHHQSYWFEHMNKRIGDILKIGINNIRQSMNQIPTDDIIHNKKSYLDSEEDITKWRNENIQLDRAETDINYLLNKKLGDPIKSFLNEI